MHNLGCRPLLFAAGGGGSGDSELTYEAVAERELAYVAQQLRRAADNDSAWNYLRGLLALPGGDAAWLHDDRIPQLCNEVGNRLLCGFWQCCVGDSDIHLRLCKPAEGSESGACSMQATCAVNLAANF